MKLIIFNLGGKEYGLDIAQVHEVIRLRAITPIPETADFVEGVISLRGKVVPVINLGVRLGMEKKGFSKNSRIIITQVDSHSVGVAVDNVSDVITLDPASITPSEQMLKDAEYLVGVARIAERLVIIADIAKLLRQDITTHIQPLHERIEVRRKQ